MVEYKYEGEKIISILYKLLVSVKLHGENNRIVKDLIHSLIFSLRNLPESEPSFSIKLSENRLYFQNEKLVYRKENLAILSKMCDYLEERSIGELKIDCRDQNLTHPSIHKALLFLNLSVKSSNPVLWLKKRYNAERITWIIPDKVLVIADEQVAPQKPEKKDPEKERRQKGQKSYINALNSIKGMTEKFAQQSAVGLRKTQRAIQNMVDLIIEDESILLGMSTIRDYDDYTYCHSVNVSILAMCLGVNIGLSRTSVEALGICGLFHDLGKIDIPTEIIRKPGKLTPDEIRIVEKHSIYSVMKILQLNMARELKSRILRPPFEHHIKFDLSGYPRQNNDRKVSLFGRILTIADVFDAITSPRSYRPVAFSPDEALGQMLEGSGSNFDPILLKAFINMIGVYPVGTLLQLDTGELGIVSGKGRSTNGNRPDVVVIKTEKDTTYKKGPLISLEERDAVTMDYIRNIIASFHPGQFGIQPAQYLL
jgi:HD-GYP domain-containing protein (c-di-GMP phosphodiesterase class II)